MKFRHPHRVSSGSVKLCSSSGKRCYPNRVAAQRDNQHLPEAVNTYFCLDCGSVHITRGRSPEDPSIYDLLKGE